ncbi:MAG TPA: hypothetical protein VFI56_24555 [Vicinamibacterales bacterium]|nr:hypothetical protein [Vicinamibacterales bacterium]
MRPSLSSASSGVSRRSSVVSPRWKTRIENLEYTRIDDRELLAAIVASTRGRAFTSKELHAHAAVDRELAAALRGLTVRRLGHRLRTLAGTAIDGWTIAKVTERATGVSGS